jgi:dCTP deaminase
MVLFVNEKLRLLKCFFPCYIIAMILSDGDLKKAINSGYIKIKPAPNFEEQLGSCSLDLRLGKSFRVFDHSKYAYIDPFKKNIGDEITREIVVKDGEPFIIQPGDFVLATTIEYVEVPDDLSGTLEGRSSIGRLGIVIHSTAAHIESGFRGNITLEIANMGKMPVALYPEMRICSIAFEQLTSPAEVPYHKKKTAKYAGQTGPKESRIHEEK